ncbi:type III PLP-dependent enzyme [Paenibacillus sp. FSL H8-0537]|uniref:type III PLP-dependent enzyme n=1 Tax=Paenibacillus sp. FSL H8-0537 TaxID=2921399 RepID=UPI0031017C4B
MSITSSGVRSEIQSIVPYIQKLKAEQPGLLCAYLRDMDALSSHVRERVQTLPRRCKLFYAIKANSEREVLAALAEIVHGFEVASLGEIRKVREISSRIPILFGGPGKTEEELEGAMEYGVSLVHVESGHELNKLNAIAERRGMVAPVLLRINLRGPLPQAKLAMGGKPTQFGIDEESLPEVMGQLQRLRHVRVEGFHFHSLSNNLDAEQHVRLVEYYCTLSRQWAAKYGLTLNYINAGGGIGVNYADLDRQFNWTEFVSGLEPMLGRELEPTTTILFECGRYLTASSGYYAVEVLDIKRNHGKDYVIIRGGTHHFRLPVSWNHSHPFERIAIEHWPHSYERPALYDGTATIVGQLCTPKDVLAQDVEMKEVRVGDVLLFRYAGAYGWAISHHDFLSHPHPEHIYVEELSTLFGGAL